MRNCFWGTVLLWLVALPGIAENKDVNCVVKGELIGMEVEEVLIVDATVDSRYHGEYIPVEDNCFKYVLKLPDTRGYKLIFVTKAPRVWHTIPFIAENGTVEIKVNADKSYTVAGGILNDKYNDYQKLRKAKVGRDRFTFMHDYFAGNLNELYYFLTVEELQRRQVYGDELDDVIVNAYQTLSKQFVSHPYTALGKTLIDGFNTIRPGGRYIEFEAPDLKGNMVNISDVIRGKVAVIDLWASWCHPCRLKAKAMIPIYEKYKDKGFVVVGVAREFKNTKNLELAIEKDGYPWLQLLELDDSRQIWTRYMLGTAGGGMFLIDRDGTIIAVNPKPEEVELKLKELLD